MAGARCRAGTRNRPDPQIYLPAVSEPHPLSLSENPLPRRRRSGCLITLEGGEGSGKSTQVATIRRMLEAVGIEVITTREPGGTPAAEALRETLLAGTFRKLGPEAEAVLFAAARIIHLDDLIVPALAAGTWVVCDRFIDSTRVYQGLVDGLDPHLLDLLETVALGALRPDLTLVLDVDAAIALQRARQRRGAASPDRFEAGDIARYQRIQAGFREIAARAGERCVLVDGARPADVVGHEIENLIARRLFSRLRREKWRKHQDAMAETPVHGAS
ncbi:MAG: dTMP kinase [Hyphomicrobiales bacterium]|nr:dTMP kinase [Hyphomicrobiales bacterium]